MTINLNGCSVVEQLLASCETFACSYAVRLLVTGELEYKQLTVDSNEILENWNFIVNEQGIIELH